MHHPTKNNQKKTTKNPIPSPPPLPPFPVTNIPCFLARYFFVFFYALFFPKISLKKFSWRTSFESFWGFLRKMEKRFYIFPYPGKTGKKGGKGGGETRGRRKEKEKNF
ncbi:MAG: hypothetical protein IPF62_00415 [Bacteroidetes bacterium]|nr:hypothetical protein [Bacteroidota bacterium]